VPTPVGYTGCNVYRDFVSHFRTLEGKREVSGVLVQLWGWYNSIDFLNNVITSAALYKFLLVENLCYTGTNMV
jgi:hypothetical protein